MKSIKKKSNPEHSLRVVPLNRLRKPRYPKAEEFSFDELEIHPFPFSSQFRSWITVVGASSLICSTVNGEGANEKPPKHPFTIADSGLPFRTSPYGTGQPSYLRDEWAREIIESVFAEYGFDLAKDYSYQNGDISFTASGFDADARVGYVWGSWETLDEDAVIHWSHLELRKADVSKQIEKNRKNPEALEYLSMVALHRVERLDRNQEHAAEFDAIKQIKDPIKRLHKLSEVYETLVPFESAEKVSLREMQAMEESKAGERDFVAVISQYQFPFHPRAFPPELEAEIEAARLVEDEKERGRLFSEITKKMAADTLQQLENSVREYLDWARSQGLQN